MSGLIIHEWIEENGGAEKVVAAMVDAFPGADLLALWEDAPGAVGTTSVRESWLSRSRLRHHKALALPAMAPTWRWTVPARPRYDWFLVSSHLFAHHARGRGLNRDVAKLVYVHSPARYLWVPELDTRGASIPARTAASVLKPLDRRRAGEATALAANSAYVRERIATTWGRAAEVIHPPVDITEIQSVADWSTVVSADEHRLLDSLPPTFLLGASRMVPYKRLDLVIRAGEVSGLPVVIAGGGPDEARLREVAARARVPVTFTGRPSTPLLRALCQRCAAFVFPPIEDFGIMPVEAMAAGAPVVCHRVGGAVESLSVAGIGAAVDAEDDDDLAAGVRSVLASGLRVPRQAMQRFSRERFIDEIRDFVTRHTQAPS